MPAQPVVPSPSARPPRGRIFIRPRWQGADGIRNILVIAIPLILSNAVMAINQFFDRMFLAWNSQDEFTAALQAGMMYWAILGFFHHTVAYCSTFVAQFIGAEDERRAGPIVWQALYVALAGGALLTVLANIGYPIFRLIGHDGHLPRLEAEYFKVMMLGSIPALLNTTAYSYFVGMGRTGLVLFVSAVVCLLNICLNTWMIFAPIWIFPSGIMGAAWASVISTGVGFLIFVALIAANRENERRFGVWSGWRPDGSLLKRLLRFGMPSGIHSVIDMSGFTTFMMVVGVFGYAAQRASNLAMNINFFLFIPALGMHAATQIMAGQLCGARNLRGVERMAAGAALITTIYMALVMIVYIGYPEGLLHWFRGGTPEAEWQEAVRLTKLLLIFVGVYTLVDAWLLVYSGALKGAGDTRFVMLVSIVFSQLLLTGPCLLIAYFKDSFATPNHGLYAAWAACTLYIFFIAAINVLRYWFGTWKAIDMIGREGTA